MGTLQPQAGRIRALASSTCQCTRGDLGGVEAIRRNGFLGAAAAARHRPEREARRGARGRSAQGVDADVDLLTTHVARARHVLLEDPVDCVVLHVADTDTEAIEAPEADCRAVGNTVIMLAAPASR